MIGIGVKRTSGSSSTFSLNSISALLQSNERFITQDDPNPITPAIVMSIPSDGDENDWVAPCAVVFAATDSTDTTTTNITRDDLFIWDFGDDKGEKWQFGPEFTRDKNMGYGHTAGHVYETPGTYTITLTIINRFGDATTLTQEITVTDPDVVFPGAATICFSNTEDFTGAPDGCTQVTTGSFTTAWEGQLALETSGKRLMFKRGDVFLVDANISSKYGISNITFAPFGPGDLPYEIQYTAETTSSIVFRVSSGSLGEPYNTSVPLRNIRFHDAKITNPSQVLGRRFCSAIMYSNTNTINGPRNSVTFLRVDCENVTGFNIDANGLAIVECRVYNNNMSTYSSALNNVFSGNCRMSMIVGNDFDNLSSGEHVCRIQGFMNVHNSNNRFLNPSDTKVCLAFRGRGLTNDFVEWTANTAYSTINTLVVPTATQPNQDLKCFRRVGITEVATSPYTTGATEPDWTTAVNIGDQVIDNDYKFELEYTRAVNTDNFGYVSMYANVHSNEYGVPTPKEGSQITLMAQIAPSGVTDNDYEPIEYVNHEFCYFGPNLSGGGGSHNNLEIHGKHITIRNNIIAGSETGASDTAFAVQGLAYTYNGTPPSDDVLIENNSVYSPHTTAIGCTLASNGGWTNIVMRNNLLYAPNGDINTTLTNTPNAELTFEGGTSTDTQMKTVSPGYAVEPPTVAADFSLTAGSYAINGGVASAGEFVDFFGTTRDRSVVPDMGAISKDS